MNDIKSILDADEKLNQIGANLNHLASEIHSDGDIISARAMKFNQQAKALMTTIKSKLFAEHDTKTAKIQTPEEMFAAVRKRSPRPLDPNLNYPDWPSVAFTQQYIPHDITVLTEHVKIDGEVVARLPVNLPFMSTMNSFVFKSDSKGAKSKLEQLHVLILRLSAMLPHAVQFALLDPVGMGQNFDFSNQLLHKRTNNTNMPVMLEEILEDISRISDNYLDVRTKRLIDVDHEIRSTEKFEFIIAADFPKSYDRRSIELLAKIANNGPRTGKYVVLQYNTEHEFPNGTSIDMFESLVNMHDIKQFKKSTDDGELFLLQSLEDETINDILEGIANATPEESKLEFSDVTNLDPASWWQGNASEEIRAAIGGSGAKKDDLELWFGRSQDRRTCSHGMLGAMTGAGKSNLYHAFIMGLACRYSPEDLQLYLIDGKQGVEFKGYPNLPHAKVVSLETSSQLARSVLAELLAEMERRNNLFQRCDVVDLSGYYKLGSPHGKLPRILMIADEFQVLFEDDRDGLSSEIMLKLSAQGRSAGIHMFIGSQRFGAPGMQNQTAIFGNIHLRVGMEMSDADITALQEFGPNGKRLLRACNQAGQMILNDAAGDDNRNFAGRVSYLDDDTRLALINQLAEKWQQHQATADAVALPHKAILLDGAGQPLIANNPQLNTLLQLHPQRPNEDQWIEYANRGGHLQGLAEPEWYPIEKPAVYWFGQELNIHGHARIILRRRPHEHLLLVGDSNEARFGMLGLFLAQLGINAPAQELDVLVLDRSIKGSPWHGIMQQSSAHLGNAVKYVEKYSEFSAQLAIIKQQLADRQAMDEEDVYELPSIYVVINEAQRVKELQKQAGRFGVNEPTSDSEILLQILEQGSELGIHLITSFDSVRALSKVFERRDTDGFRHKIALQMSEEDSFNLLKLRQASQLQNDCKHPIYGLYVDQMQNNHSKFKAYCVTDRTSYQNQLQQLSEQLERWQG